MGTKGTESQFQQWLDRGLWVLLCSVAMYFSQQVRELSQNVVDLRIALNTNTVAVESAKSELSDHEVRIRALEGASRRK